MINFKQRLWIQYIRRTSLRTWNLKTHLTDQQLQMTRYTVLLLLLAVAIAAVAHRDRNQRPDKGNEHSDHRADRSRCIKQADGKLKCYRSRHHLPKHHRFTRTHRNRFGVTPAVGPNGMICYFTSNGTHMIKCL